MDKVEDFCNASFSQCYIGEIGNLGSSMFCMKEPIFDHQLSVNLSGDRFEVPTFLLSVAIRAKSLGYDRLVFSLSSQAYIITHGRTMVGSILEIFRYANVSHRLVEVVTNHDETYYGNKGLVLDSDYNILLVTTVCVRIENGLYFTEGIKCRVSSDVFRRQDEVIPKAIVKKIIPYYSINSIYTDFGPKCDNGFYQILKPEIIIGVGPNILITKNIPKPSTANDRHFNQIIIDHLEGTNYDT